MKPAGNLEVLYRQHALAVFRFALGLCRNTPEAEDIVAETFARALTRVDRIRSATARAYLLTVARNIFLDERRRSSRDAHMLAELERMPSDSPTVPDDETRLARALAALGMLPEGERAALMLRVDHAMPYQDIAKALNISLAAAKVRVHRARLKLTSMRMTGGWDDDES